jgi:hypothetical protein
MSSKNSVGVQNGVQRAASIKSRLNRAFNSVRIVSDNESMKGWQTSQEQKFHHSIYVVLFDNAVANQPSILRVNPKRDPLKPCVYVGMTGLPVDHHFENHKLLVDCSPFLSPKKMSKRNKRPGRVREQF